MKILQRYIGINILSSIGLVIVLLVGLQIFISFISEMNDIGRGDYNALEAFIYALGGTPFEIYSFFPMASLIGALLALGTMAQHSELVVMRTSGMSIGKIITAVLMTGFVIIMIVTVMGEFFAPKAMHYAETRKAIAISGGQAVRTVNGLWLRDKQNFIHIASIEPGGKLNGVSRYQYDENHRLLKESYAEHAIYRDKKWILKGVSESDINEKQIVSKKHAVQVWDIALKPTLLALSAVEPEELSLPKLFRYIWEQKANNLSAGEYELAFWQRLIQPLTTCVMLFIAIPFIFGPLRSSTLGLRLVSGIVVGFSFNILNRFFGPLSMVYQIPVSIGAAIPTILVALLAYLLMRRVS